MRNDLPLKTLYGLLEGDHSSLCPPHFLYELYEEG